MVRMLHDVRTTSERIGAHLREAQSRLKEDARKLARAGMRDATHFLGNRPMLMAAIAFAAGGILGWVLRPNERPGRSEQRRVAGRTGGRAVHRIRGPRGKRRRAARGGRQKSEV